MPTKRATRKRVRVLAVPDNPVKVLAELYPREEDDTDRVEVDETTIYVDGETISQFGTMDDEMPGCCGVAVIHDVDGIAPAKKEAYAAVHALYLNNKSFGSRGCATLATTNSDQRNAASFFRANGWKEIPLGVNPNSGNQITLWLLKRN